MVIGGGEGVGGVRGDLCKKEWEREMDDVN